MANTDFNVSNPYQVQLDELARRQKMAEIMQQQSFQPIERFSYQGIEAPISPLSGLAKALEGYMGGQEQKKILGEKKALGEKYQKEGMEDITKYAQMANAPAVAAVLGQSAYQPETADFEDRFATGAPDLKLNQEGMVPAVAPVEARMRGQIDPSMIGQLKTPEMQRMALAQMLKQGEAPAAFNLGEGEVRYQSPKLGAAPVAIARGGAKPLPSPFAALDVTKFTKDSVTAAINPDGTIDRTKLVPIPQLRTGDLGVYDEYVKQEKDAGRVPKSIDKFITDQKVAGRTPAAQRERFVFDSDRGGIVNLDTGIFTPATQGGLPLGEKNKPLTETQSKAVGFASRADEADKIINVVGEGGKYTPSLIKAGAESVPLVGGALGTAANLFAPSSKEQQIEQAQRNFVNALLRQESGASISPTEFSNAQRQYFPQVGDSPEVILQKAANRKTSIDALKVQAGPGMEKMPKKPSAAPQRARNPTTGAEIISTDGGNTWQPAGGK
jgi:hypothetical protein